jgi:hypothetical protein
MHIVRKVAMLDASRSRRPDETLVLVQAGRNWYEVDAYLTDAPPDIAGEWVQAVLAKMKQEGISFEEAL